LTGFSSAAENYIKKKTTLKMMNKHCTITLFSMLICRRKRESILASKELKKILNLFGKSQL